MSVALSDRPESPRRSLASAIARLVDAGQRVVAERNDAVIVALALGAYVALWMVFDTVSFLTVAVRTDAREAAVWAQHFAFGYKHPPMTAWLFALWFAVFARTDWSLHLLTLTTIGVTLAITWRLLRDHLDKNRALFGLAALFLVPLYNFKAPELNANTAMMPFWAAALLFYLRARLNLSVADALLAGACAGLALLSKYWSVYLFAGMGIAALAGPGIARFWRSPAPYVMAAAAAIVIAPHAYWYVAHSGGTNYDFMRQSVMTRDSFATAFGKSTYYVLGSLAYAAGPLLLLAALRPNKSVVAGIVWPSDDTQRQVLILFAVPLVLPALVNLIAPYRITPDWTFPNWALLPVLLYRSPSLAIDARKAAGAGLVAFAVALAFVAVSPIIAYAKLVAGPDPERPDSQQVAAVAERLTDKPLQLYWGSASLTESLPFYVAGMDRLKDDPLSDLGRDEIAAQGLVVACRDDDKSCLTAQAAVAGAVGAHSANATISRSFLGFAAKPIGFRVTVVPAR
jgi:4-amino-4-deoxy-L-arabinose transferase-like glycosyltransferase